MGGWNRRGVGCGRSHRRGGIGGVRRSGATIVPVYLWLDQSNGGPAQGDAYSSPPALPRSDIRMMLASGGVEDAATQDLDELSTRGPEVGVGVTVADGGRDLFFVKYVWNATGIISNWVPGTSHVATATVGLYSRAVRFAFAAMARYVVENPGTQPVLAGIIYGQWETEAVGGAGGVGPVIWPDWVRTMRARSREEFHPDLPWILTGPGDNFSNAGYDPANVALIDTACDTLASEDANTYRVSMDGLTYQGDGVHYTSDSQLARSIDVGTQILAISVPDYSSGFTRVTMRTSKAAAGGAGVALQSPGDDSLWAEADGTGPVLVPTATWPLAASDSKVYRTYPSTLSIASAGDTTKIDNGDLGIIKTGGLWHIKFRPAAASTSHSSTVVIVQHTTTNRITLLSTDRIGVHVGGTVYQSDVLTWAADDELAVEWDSSITDGSDNLRFLKNGVQQGAAQGVTADWSALTQVLQIGTVSLAGASLFTGEVDEPVVGAYA